MSVLSVALLAGNALAYLMVVLAARLLAPEAFGELATLQGLLLIGVVPAAGMQATAALMLAGDRGRGGRRDAVRAVHRTALVVTGGTVLLALAAVPVLAGIFRLETGALLWLVAVLVPHVLAGGYDGILQGTGRPVALAVAMCALGIAKVSGGITGLLLVATPGGVLAGMAAGAGAGAAVSWWLCGRPGASRRTDRALTLRVGRAAAALLGFVVLTNLDLLLARHHLPAAEAGRYAVGSILFKIAFWLPQGLTVALVPGLARPEERGRNLALGAGAMAVVAAVMVPAVAVAEPLVRAVLGPGTPDAVWLFAMLGSLLAVAQLLLYSGIAGSDPVATVAVWSATAAQCLLVTVLAVQGRAGIVSVVGSALVVVAGLVVHGAVRAVRDGRRTPRSRAGRTGQVPV